MTFYLLSLATGILECGWIAFGAVRSLPLWKILCFPLAYHLGNLFPKPFALSRKHLVLMSVFSLFTGGITFIKQLSENTAFIMICITLFLLSAVMQSMRGNLKSDGNRLIKRIYRVGGFALSPLAAVFPSVILICSSVIVIFSLKDHRGSFNISRPKGQKGFSAVMLLHQLHYFFYAHITLVAISILFVSTYSFIGTVFAAVLFCCTWVTYMSVEPIVSKLTPKVTLVFYAGHIGISLLLFIMSFVTSNTLFVILWLITGFGGGTVYTISTRAKKKGSFDKDSMTISENIGHTLGLLIAVVIAALFGIQSQHIMLILGAASAMLAVIVMTFISGKENRNEIVNNQS